MISICRKNQK